MCVRHFIGNATEAYKKETAPPSEVDEEAKNGEGVDAPPVLVEELAVTFNLSEAEQALRAGEESCSPEVANKLKAGLRVAERKVAGLVNLVVDSPDLDSLEAQLKNLMPVVARGGEESKSYVAIVLDAKVLCESGSQAKYRLPPTRPGQVKRLIDAVLSTRVDGDLHESDVFITLDGGKENEWEAKNILKHLPAKRYSTLKHFVTYTYESVEKRTERASKGNLQLHEVATFISSGEGLPFKAQPRLVTAGSTRGNVIGALTKPSLTESAETWMLPHAVKKTLFGDENLPLPGGSCPVEHEVEKGGAKKDELVPAFFHEGPEVLASELAHFVQACAVIDLTPGSGHWAMHCLRHRTPHVGVCLSPTHKELLAKKLVSRTLTAMASASDEQLYDPGFAKEVKKVASRNDSKDDEVPEPESKTNPNPKKGAKKRAAGPVVKEPKAKKLKGQGQSQDPTPEPLDNSREALLKKIAEAAKADEGEEGEEGAEDLAALNDDDA